MKIRTRTYNVIRDLDVAMLKDIMVPSMTTHFPQLPNNLAPRTSPPDILELMEDEDTDLHISRCMPPPLTAER